MSSELREGFHGHGKRKCAALAPRKRSTSARCREAKAAEKIVPVHELQLINYLHATGMTVGLLLNFEPRATFRRLVLSYPPKESAVTRLAPRESAVPP